jgi:hypothetical protein
VAHAEIEADDVVTLVVDFSDSLHRVSPLRQHPRQRVVV